MTLADAITCARAGEDEGFSCLFEVTIPNVWLAATILGCSQCGSIVTQIYQKAQQSISSLHSPSDLRVWMGCICYDILLRQPENTGRMIPSLTGILHETYTIMIALPRQERLALLLMCGEGCSAPQAAEILAVPDIEIKRAMRRARQTIAAAIEQKDQNCNTSWLIAQLAAVREVQSLTDAEMQQQILHCILTGETYVEPTQQESLDAAPEILEEQPKSEEKNGFFQKLFRSRRFG